MDINIFYHRKYKDNNSICLNKNVEILRKLLHDIIFQSALTHSLIIDCPDQE